MRNLGKRENLCNAESSGNVQQYKVTAKDASYLNKEKKEPQILQGLTGFPNGEHRKVGYELERLCHTHRAKHLLIHFNSVCKRKS